MTDETMPKVIGAEVFDDTPCAWEYKGPVPDHVPGARSWKMGTEDFMWLCRQHSYRLRQTVSMSRKRPARQYLPRFCPPRTIQRADRWKGRAR